MIKRYLLYLIRWQLSTPVLAPIVSYFTTGSLSFGTREGWIGSAVANFIGGLIFFWVDRFIFTSEKLGTIWQVKDNVKCSDCGKITRGYRLVKTKNYDRTRAIPQFRCEECSIKKTEALKKNGVNI
jgi:hypothetical protein